MVCNERINIAIEWTADTDAARVEEAIKNTGSSAYWNRYNHEISFYTEDSVRAEELNRRIKREYSALTVKAAAKKMGWTLKSDRINKNNQREFVIAKRR